MILFLKKYPAVIVLVLIIIAAISYGFRLRTKVQQPQASTLLTYQDPEYHFSFQYGKQFKIKAVNDPTEGKVVLVEEPEGKNSFQINILAFNDSKPLTQDRILQEMPGFHMEDIRTFRTGKNEDIDALNFFTKDPKIGDLFAVWFTHDHRLYQVFTPRKAQVHLLSVLRTFSF